MNNCEIKSPPVFSQKIPKWDRNTYADGNAMGAVIEQLFNNTVYNKEELKAKTDAEGGDISETQVSVIDESTEAFPVPMPEDKTKGLWGKLKKWQQDCLAKFGNYVLTSMITNQHVNSTENIPSSALVYLMQQGITQLNRDLEGKSDASHYHDRVMVYNGYPHIAGISYITTDKFTIPKIIIDETVMDLIRNTTQTEAKINDIAIDWSTAPWRLKVNLWINGVTYTRYINFTN